LRRIVGALGRTIQSAQTSKCSSANCTAVRPRIAQGGARTTQSLQISRCGSVIGAAARPKTVRRRVIMTLMKRVYAGCALGTGVWRSIETWKRIDYIITNCQPAHDSDTDCFFQGFGK
jgi:hypothetical protein